MIFKKLEEWAKTDRIAAVDTLGNELTFASLASRSDAIAADWEKTLPPKSNIVICGDKQNDVLCCMFAALKSGHAYSFVPEYFPEHKLKSILTKSGAEILVYLCGTPEFEIDQKVIDQNTINSVAESGEKPSIDSRHKDDDIAMIFFTSGSTGEPKGVMISMHNLTAFTSWWGEVVNKGIDRLRVLNFSSYAFSASLSTIYCFMLWLGGTLFAVDRAASQSLSRLTKLIYEVGPNYLDCTPSFMDLCMLDTEFGSKTLPSMKFISVGGEPLTPQIAQKLVDRFYDADIVNGYGTTETTIGTIFCHVTQQIIDNCDGPLPIGYTKEGSYIFVVDENRNPVPDGEQGELVIASELVSQGYFGDPKKTASSFYVDENGKRAFYTGDIVRKQPDGLVYYIGRSNNTLKIGGYRVELGEIELRLNTIEGVKQGIAVPVYRDGRAVMLAAFVILETGSESGLNMISKIKRELRESLPPYMVPSKINFVDEFPKNSNDKLDRSALIERVRLN